MYASVSDLTSFFPNSCIIKFLSALDYGTDTGTAIVHSVHFRRRHYRMVGTMDSQPLSLLLEMMVFKYTLYIFCLGKLFSSLVYLWIGVSSAAAVAAIIMVNSANGVGGGHVSACMSVFSAIVIVNWLLPAAAAFSIVLKLIRSVKEKKLWLEHFTQADDDLCLS